VCATNPSPAGSSLKLKHYQFLLSFRYLKSRFSSIAALLSVTFGVAVILILLGIMGGYIEELQESIRGQVADLTIVGRDTYPILHAHRLQKLVEEVDNVTATAPFVNALAMYRSTGFNPCQLKGIDPELEPKVSGFGDYVLRPEELSEVLALREEVEPVELERGSAAAKGAAEAKVTARLHHLLGSPERAAVGPAELETFFSNEYGAKLLALENPSSLPALGGEVPEACLVGIQLLLERELFLGQLVSLITVQPGKQEPVSYPFLVAGAFKTGDFDADSKAIYVHGDALKNMLGLFDEKANSYRYEGLRVAIQDDSRLEETRAAIQEKILGHDAFADLHVFPWQAQRQNLLRAVQIEKFIVFFLLLVVQSFSGFMILLMLTLIVIEKTRDMGILLALGGTQGGITKVFLFNGLILTLAGTALGLALGYSFCTYINPIHDWVYSVTGIRLFDPKIYNMDRVPIALRPEDVLLSVAAPLGFGFLASLLPALWAARRDPIKAIHYE